MFRSSKDPSPGDDDQSRALLAMSSLQLFGLARGSSLRLLADIEANEELGVYYISLGHQGSTGVLTVASVHPEAMPTLESSYVSEACRRSIDVDTAASHQWQALVRLEDPDANSYRDNDMVLDIMGSPEYWVGKCNVKGQTIVIIAEDWDEKPTGSDQLRLYQVLDHGPYLAGRLEFLRRRGT